MDTKKVYSFEALCCLACGVGRVLGISVIPSLLTKNRRGIADLTTESAWQLRVFSAETWQMLFLDRKLGGWWTYHLLRMVVGTLLSFWVGFLAGTMLVLVRPRKTDMVLDWNASNETDRCQKFNRIRTDFTSVCFFTQWDHLKCEKLLARNNIDTSLQRSNVCHFAHLPTIQETPSFQKQKTVASKNKCKKEPTSTLLVPQIANF